MTSFKRIVIYLNDILWELNRKNVMQTVTAINEAMECGCKRRTSELGR
jgi:hypothetical protein